MNMSLEKLEKTLKSHPAIENLTTCPNEHGFNRTFEFKIRGTLYQIIWFSNISKLFIGEMQVYFDSLEITDTFPNNFRKNIHFIFNDDLAAVLPLEEYEVKS